MLLNKIQIQNLWEININILNKRSPSWILRSLIFPFAMLAVLVMVRQYSFIVDLIILATFLLLVLSIYAGVSSIKKIRFRKPYSYNLSVFLYQAYDFIFLASLAFVFWGTGDDMLFRSNSLDLQAIRILRVYLLIILLVSTAFMLIFSPLLTIQKLKRFSTPSQTSKSHIYILIAMNTLPSFIAFAAIMLTRTGNGFQSLFISGIVCIVMGFFILTLLANNLFEIAVLFINKWPMIERDKLGFNVRYLPH